MQILSVTANNTSNNNTMIKHLSEILEGFPGVANQTHCFAHTHNISAKAILKQFDLLKGRLNKDLQVDAAVWTFADLTAELDIEEQSVWETEEVGDDEDDDQPLDSCVDLCEGLTEEEVRELNASIQPMHLMLSKVC